MEQTKFKKLMDEHAEIIGEMNTIEQAYSRANAAQHAVLKQRHAELKDQLKALNARMHAEREAQRRADEDAKTAAREREHMAAVEAAVRTQLRASWPGDSASFEKAFPEMFDAWMKHQALENAATALERKRREYGGRL